MSLLAFLGTLRQAGIEPTPLEIAEALWLVQHLPPPPRPTPAGENQPAPDVELSPSSEALPAEPGPAEGNTEQMSLATPAQSFRATPMQGTPVRVPEPPGLTYRRDIQRALRPLRRRVPSRWRQDLDVPATVQYIASTGVWSPVLRPAMERWFDVIVAVDTAASMDLWRHLVEELRDVLVQTGAFRDVRFCRLNALADGCTVEIGADRSPRSPRELIDGSGRRLFLVVTDGAAVGWHEMTATATLASWGETSPVAVLQPLPESMWFRTGLPAVAARITSATIGAPNSRLRAVYRRRVRGMPLPVLGLEPAAIAAWAALITHPVTDVPLAATSAGAASLSGPAPEVERNGADALDDFRATASPEAFRLAVCLSLVPLSLPVMRLVQHVTVPRSRASALAEVVLGGLMTRVGQEAYEFRDGVRDRLVGELRRSEVATVLAAVSDWVTGNAGLAGRTFAAVLGREGETAVVASPFAWVPPTVAARLGIGPRLEAGVAGGEVSSGRRAAPRTLIAVDTADISGGLLPRAAMYALGAAFRAAGHPASDLSILSGHRNAVAATSIDVVDVVGRIFDYVGPSVWNAIGSSDDYTGVRMAVHRLSDDRHGESEAETVRRLQTMVRSDTLGEAIGARGNRAGLIISDEVHELLALSHYPDIRAFRHVAQERSWIRTAVIAGVEVLPDAGSSPDSSHAVPAAALAERRAELDRLAAFAVSDLPYLCVIGPPASGKTPLLKAFAIKPPPGVEVRSLFMDRTTTPEIFRAFLVSAIAADPDRRVVLVLDGIDETDPDVTVMLPTGHENLGVVVSIRPDYQLPPGLPSDHPLHHCEVRLLRRLADPEQVNATGDPNDFDKGMPAGPSAPAAVLSRGPEDRADTYRPGKIKIDVLIVTALREEYEAARAVVGLSQWQEHGTSGPAPYGTARYRTSTGETISVALARPTRKGGRSTGRVASTLIDQLQPACLAMCGVCAGNPAVTAPGDVIVASPAYELDKAKHAGGSFRADLQQFPLEARWLRLVQDFDPSGLPSHGVATDDEAAVWYLDRLYRGHDPRTHPTRQRYFPQSTWSAGVQRLASRGLITQQGAGFTLTDAGRNHLRRILSDEIDGPDRLPFAVVPGAMVSGASDHALWDLREVAQRRILALEMEAATIATVAHQRQVPHWLVAKGVMDHADGDRTDRFKSFAARASAEVLFALLGTLLKPMAPTEIAGSVKLEIVRRLEFDWPDLADVVGVPQWERSRFRAGDEPEELWRWIEARGRLADLSSALDEIGRTDLAELLRPYPPASLT